MAGGGGGPRKRLCPPPAFPLRVIGLRVARPSAEGVRKRLSAHGFVDTGREILEEGSSVVLPVLRLPDDDILPEGLAEVVEREFPVRCSRRDPIDRIRGTAEVPERLKGMLPRRWESFGDVLVLRLPGAFAGREEAVARAYADVLGAKSVLLDEGGVVGEMRTPVVRVVFGDDPVATHRENGVLFRFDASRIMFSSGNVDERARVSRLDCDGETIVDMFAGIGYFSVPVAVHRRPERVVACELNPTAFRFLRENVSLNAVEDRVEPVLGDNRSLPGESFADRVFMGYVKTTHEYLGTAGRIIRDGGILHYHETCPCELLPGRPLARLTAAFGEGNVEVLALRKVKSYSPGVSHVVVDARISKGA